MTVAKLPAAEWPRAVALVAAAGLPTADLRPGVQSFWGAVADGRLLGVIAWERVGDEALVRSFAVEERLRGTGIGTALHGELEKAARAEGLDRLVLLTETAERFFLAQGYLPTDRASLGPGIQATAEFTGLCPVSAVCLSKGLQ